jgi:hypothetical protein
MVWRLDVDMVYMSGFGRYISDIYSERESEKLRVDVQL